ncbi:MAG: hypothetical protein HZC24_05080 [Rhodocyclales bacterium]|nr:hypothetical protein [Rhodocyclales bacterium]
MAIVHIANILAQLAEVSSTEPADADAIDPLAWIVTGLSADSIAPAVSAVQAEIEEVEKLFTDAT